MFRSPIRSAPFAQEVSDSLLEVRTELPQFSGWVRPAEGRLFRYQWDGPLELIAHQMDDPPCVIVDSRLPPFRCIEGGEIGSIGRGLRHEGEVFSKTQIRKFSRCHKAPLRIRPNMDPGFPFQEEASVYQA